MTKISLLVQCGRCNGTGIDDNKRDNNGNIVLESCTSCDGTGKIGTGEIDISDIMDKLNDIKEKVDEIKETVDGL